MPDRNDVRARLTALERSMTKTEESRLSALRERLTALERKRVLRDPMAFIADKRLLLDYTQKSLASLAEKQVGERRQRFAARDEPARGARARLCRGADGERYGAPQRGRGDRRRDD